MLDADIFSVLEPVWLLTLYPECAQNDKQPSHQCSCLASRHVETSLNADMCEAAQPQIRPYLIREAVEALKQSKISQGRCVMPVARMPGVEQESVNLHQSPPLLKIPDSIVREVTRSSNVPVSLYSFMRGSTTVTTIITH